MFHKENCEYRIFTYDEVRLDAFFYIATFNQHISAGAAFCLMLHTSILCSVTPPTNIKEEGTCGLKYIEINCLIY